MEEATNKNNLEKEAQNYIHLGTLIQKDRSQAKKDAVELIVTSNLNILEKIKEIDKLDNASEPVHGRFNDTIKVDKNKTSIESDTQFYVQSDHVKRSVIDSIRSRSKLIAPHKRSDFFEFFFIERHKILNLGLKSGLISPGILGFSPQLNQSTSKRLTDSLVKEQLPKLKPGITKLLESAWHQLDKYEYNLISAFNRLLDEIAKANFTFTSKKNVDYTLRFFNLENAFLFFHTKNDYINDLLHGIDKAMSVDPTLDEERKQILVASKCILMEGIMKPCLQDFMITISTLQARHALCLNDLIIKDASTLISKKEFDCTSPVQKEIDSYIASMVVNLEPLVKKSIGMDASVRFIPCNENEELTFESFEAITERGILNPDKNIDSGKLACIAVSAYLKFFGSIIDSKLLTASNKTIRILPEKLLEYELQKLEYAALAIKKLGNPLPYSRYKAIKTASSLPTKFEADLVSAISEVASLFRMIAFKISDYVDRLLKAQAASKESESKTIEQSPLNETLANKTPFGTSVGEIAASAAITAYSISGYFLNEDILKIINSKRVVKDEIRTTMRTLERLALEEEYRSIREHFGLLGY